MTKSTDIPHITVCGPRQACMLGFYICPMTICVNLHSNGVLFTMKVASTHETVIKSMSLVRFFAASIKKKFFLQFFPIHRLPLSSYYLGKKVNNMHIFDFIDIPFILSHPHVSATSRTHRPYIVCHRKDELRLLLFPFCERGIE